MKDLKKVLGSPLYEAQVARRMGMSRQRVAAWFTDGRRIPAERLPELCLVIGKHPRDVRPGYWARLEKAIEAAEAVDAKEAA